MLKLVCINDNKNSLLDKHQSLVHLRQAEKPVPLFIFKMNSGGAVPNIEETETVGVVETAEESFSDLLYF